MLGFCLTPRGIPSYYSSSTVCDGCMQYVMSRHIVVPCFVRREETLLHNRPMIVSRGRRRHVRDGKCDRESVSAFAAPRLACKKPSSADREGSAIFRCFCNLATLTLTIYCTAHMPPHHIEEFGALGAVVVCDSASPATSKTGNTTSAPQRAAGRPSGGPLLLTQRT